MSRIRQVIDIVGWIFTLLTLSAAAFILWALCVQLWQHKEDMLKEGETFFKILFIATSGFITWKTAKWLWFKPEEINGTWLLLFWFALIFILFWSMAMDFPTWGSS
jgi:hypothetical protein